MSTDRLRDIHERLRRAPAGPWGVTIDFVTGGADVRQVLPDGRMGEAILSNARAEDAELVRCAREDLAWGLREIWRLRRALAAPCPPSRSLRATLRGVR